MRNLLIVAALVSSAGAASAQTSRNNLDFGNQPLAGMTFSTGEPAKGATGKARKPKSKAAGKAAAAPPSSVFDPYEKARKAQQDYFRRQGEINDREKQAAEKNQGAYKAGDPAINLFGGSSSASPSSGGTSSSGPRGY